MPIIPKDEIQFDEVDAPVSQLSGKTFKPSEIKFDDEPAPTRRGLGVATNQEDPSAVFGGKYHVKGAAKEAGYQALEMGPAALKLPNVIGRTIERFAGLSEEEVTAPAPIGDALERVGHRGLNALRKQSDADPDIRGYREAVSRGTESFPTKVLGNIGPTAAGIATSFVPVVGPPLALTLFMGMNTEDAYRTALERGATPENAERVAVTAGSIMSLLDQTGISVITKKTPGAGNFTKKLLDMAESAMVEGGTEVVQDVVAKIGGEWAARNPKENVAQFADRMSKQLPALFEGSMETFKIAAATGGLFRGAGHGIDVLSERRKIEPSRGKEFISVAPAATGLPSGKPPFSPTHILPDGTVVQKVEEGVVADRQGNIYSEEDATPTPAQRRPPETSFRARDLSEVTGVPPINRGLPLTEPAPLERTNDVDLTESVPTPPPIKEFQSMEPTRTETVIPQVEADLITGETITPVQPAPVPTPTLPPVSTPAPAVSPEIERPRPQQTIPSIREETLPLPEMGKEAIPPSKQVEENPFGLKGTDKNSSLVDFVRASGGINEKQMAGDVRQRFSIKEGFNLVNRKTGKTLDKLRKAAAQHGFVPEDSTPADFLESLRRDVDSISGEGKGAVFSRYYSPDLPGYDSPEAKALERRTDVKKRKLVARMTREEMKKELLTSAKAGIPNDRAYEEAERRPIQAMLDMDGLKWINDNLGHEAGDAFIRAIGDAIQTSEIEGYHLSGDEFAGQFDREVDAYAKMETLRDALRNGIVTVEYADGSTRQFKGLEFSYGVGSERTAADTALYADKARRRDSGERAKTSTEPPPSLVEVTPPESGSDNSGTPGPQDRGGPQAETEDFRLTSPESPPEEQPKAPTAQQGEMFSGSETMQTGTRPIIAEEAKDFFKPLEPEVEQPSLLDQKLEEAREQVDTEPSEAQIEANNYAHGHIRINGLDISIENPKGSTRKIGDKSFFMNYDYGYIKGTTGADKEHIDVYLGPDLESEKVFVVNQVDPEKNKFDEQKVMLGFSSSEEAKTAYMKQYDNPAFFGSMTEMSIDEFKKRLAQMRENGRKRIAPREVHNLRLKLEKVGQKEAAEKLKMKGGEAQFSLADRTPTFFSQLRRVVADKMPNLAPGNQVLNIIKKGSVKAEEIEWGGIEEFLKGKPKVAKQEVLDFIDQNNVQIEEVTKARKSQYNYTTSEEWQQAIDQAEASGNFDEAERINRAWEGINEDTGSTAGMPRFGGSDTVLPGGENYRELLLTLPTRENSPYSLIDKDGKPIRQFPNYQDASSYYNSLPQSERLKTKIGPVRNSQEFKSSHFEEPNILAHIRFNDRTDTDGKRVLFIEEIQSDWHQKGRREGYKKIWKDVPPGYKMEEKKVDLIGGKTLFRITDENGVFAAQGFSREDALKKLSESSNSLKVPDAPFKKTWHELALKRILRYAAENGYDRLAFTTGDQQAERYDLSRYISEISYSGTNLKAFDHNGNEVISRTGVTREELPDFIGKDAAEKLMAQAPQGTLRTISGLDLKVGGEGMKGFYDQILPSFLSKYAKKWGAKVKEIEIGQPDVGKDEVAKIVDNPDGDGFMLSLENEYVSNTVYQSREAAEKALKKWNGDVGIKVHGMDITDAMKKSVLSEGQPLFSKVRGSIRLTADQYRKIVADLQRIIAPGSRIVLKGQITASAEGNEKALASWGMGDMTGEIRLAGLHRTVRLNNGQLASLIQLSLRDMNENTPFHEAWHSVENLLLSDKEIETLRAAFPDKDGVASTERTADAFADWVAKEKIEAPGRVRLLFLKIRTFFEKLGNALRGRGFTSVEDLFGKAFAGELRERGTKGLKNRAGESMLSPMTPERGPGQEPTESKPPQPEGGKQRKWKRPFWADEFESAGGKIDSDGTVLLYHATTKEKAEKILQEGILRRPSDAPDSYGVYFSSSKDVAQDYGDGTLIPVRVRVEDINPDDSFPGRRLDFYASTRNGIFKPVSIGDVVVHPDLRSPSSGDQFSIPPRYKTAQEAKKASEEKRNLKIKLRAAEKASKEGFRAGVSEERAKSDAKIAEMKRDRTAIVNRLKNSFAEKLEEIGRAKELSDLKADILTRNVESIKKEIAEYAKKHLPMEARGAMLSNVAKAKTHADLIRAFARVDKIAEQVERKAVISEFKDVLNRISESNTIAVAYRDRIRDLLSNLEFSEGRYRRAKALMIDGGIDPETEAMMEAMSILARKPLSELSTDEIRAMLNEIVFLEELGRQAEITRKELWEARKEAIKERLVAGTSPIEKPEGRAIAAAQHVDLAVTPMDAVIDRLDGGKGSYDGANMAYFKKPIDSAWGNFLDAIDPIKKQAWEKAQKLQLTNEDFERIGIYAADQQEGGREKLLNNGLTDAEIDAIQLRPSEMEFYQWMRKELDALWPRIAKIMADIYGKPFGKVKNYFSFMTDWEKLTEMEVVSRLIEAPEYAPRTKHPEMSFTKSRVGPGGQKIKLNAMEIFLRHTENAEYLINMGPTVKMLYEVANSKEYGTAAGEKGQSLMVQWLDLIARKGGIQGDRQIAILDILRRNVGVATMAFKLSSALVQPSSIVTGASLIGRYAFTGSMDVATSKRWREFLTKNFPEIRDRDADDPAFMELSDRKWLARMTKIGLGPLKKLDLYAASSIAAGAYRKYLNEHGQTLDFEKPNRDAIAYAELMLRRTQASMFFKDTPLAISRGALTGNRSLDKVLFQFQNFALNNWSLIRHDLWRAGIREKNPAKAVRVFTWLTLATLAEVGLRDLAGFLTGQDDDDPVEKEMVQEALNKVPFLSHLVSAIVYQDVPIPVISTLMRIPKGIGRMLFGKEPETKARGLVSAVEGAGRVAGIPGAAQVGQSTREALSD